VIEICWYIDIARYFPLIWTGNKIARGAFREVARQGGLKQPDRLSSLNRTAIHLTLQDMMPHILDRRSDWIPSAIFLASSALPLYIAGGIWLSRVALN
jgi:hypothetical protein